MFKKSIPLSVVVAVSMFVAGCGSSSDGKKSDDLSKLPKVSSGVKTLAKSITNQGMFGSMLQSAKPDLNNDRSRKVSRVAHTQSCINGGTMTVDNGLNPQDLQNPDFDFSDFSVTTTMEYDNCLMDGDITDGKIDI